MARPIEASSYLFGGNTVFIEEMYQRYKQNTASVSEDWQDFFADLGDHIDDVVREVRGPSWVRDSNASIVGYRDPDVGRQSSAVANDSLAVDRACSDSIKLLMLIRSYRIRGHLLASLDPLNLEGHQMHSDLDPATYGFEQEDYDRPIYLGGALLGVESATLREVIDILRSTYSASIGAEFMHIESLEQREWIEEKLEEIRTSSPLTSEDKKRVLKNVIEAESFERFLHVKYPGTKRFSIEGGEATIPALEAAIYTAADLGVEEVLIGMPHRGRLNVLTAVMGKPYSAMLAEFQGGLAHPEAMKISGDVKYHLGTSSDRTINGNTVHLSLSPNPSHLEAVNPVVAGRVRAKQDQRGDAERRRVMGVLLHGDAAFAGQGVVAETLLLGDLVGYTTGGTVHVIVNNQIGFTTSPKNARLSPYPTEVAKVVQAPIFHVNGDDPAAVTVASRIAAEFRAKFKKDIVIDIICYRRHGHNEGDEPSFTQPLMYKTIADKKTPMYVYGEKLISEGVVTQEEFDGMVSEFHGFMEKEHKVSLDYKPNKADWLEGRWSKMKRPKKGQSNDATTGVDEILLRKVGERISEVPQHIEVHRKIVRQLEAKRKMIESGEGFDWATAEALAFGTLLLEGHKVRMTGQDSRRGTFSHRHSTLIDQNTEENYVPLQHLDKKQATLEIVDSNLSEFAVLGFEYGYSLAEPDGLTLWEAQFGDFVNGAQVIIDQFITSGEIKWLRMSGLTMLLPHGYEGQGPEHSSARLERFLQACAEDNIQVANCTTPANYFHILRRQLHRDFRKPLIIMAPKSLLRHKRAVSSFSDMTQGTSFKAVISEIGDLVSDSKVKRLVLCSGKVYYDLLEAREAREINNIAIARLEQFYPFPEDDVEVLAKKYKNAELVWCQEEPKNMGGWGFVESRIEAVLAGVGNKALRPVYVGRKAAASPAAGYAKIHNEEQAQLVNDALTL